MFDGDPIRIVFKLQEEVARWLGARHYRGANWAAREIVLKAFERAMRREEKRNRKDAGVG